MSKFRVFLFSISLLSSGLINAESILNGIRISNDNNKTRLVLDLQLNVNSNIFYLKNPDRLVIDLDATRLSSSFKERSIKNTLIKDIRFAKKNNQSLRVVLDLKKELEFNYFLIPGTDSNNSRLVIDLNTQVTSSPIKNTALKTKKLRDILVVIDPGHGGKDPGAIGPNGTRESNVALAIGLRLADYFNNASDMQAILTRNDNTFVALRDRMENARKYKADLFISVHADALDNPRVKGASIYTLSLEGASNEASKILAKRENKDSSIGEVPLSGKDADIVSLLTDLSQNVSMEASREVGSIILNELAKVGSIRKKKVQQAGFLVLKSPDVPSILIETTFISNPSEEKKLKSKSYQSKVAKAIFQGARNYFLINPPENTKLANNLNTQAQTISYIVKNGDTLSEIAELYNISLSLLRSFNGIKGSKIRIGQLLQIPLYK